MSSSVTSDADGSELNRFDSVIVHGSSVAAWESGYNSDHSPDSVASSAIRYFESKRIQYPVGSLESADNELVLDGETASVLIRKLARALEVTTCELKKTETELREALLELDQLRTKAFSPKPRNRRSGSCPTTFSNFALPMPTSALFSAIHRIVRQDSY